MGQSGIHTEHEFDRLLDFYKLRIVQYPLQYDKYYMAAFSRYLDTFMNLNIVCSDNVIVTMQRVCIHFIAYRTSDTVSMTLEFSSDMVIIKKHKNSLTCQMNYSETRRLDLTDLRADLSN